MLTEQKHAQIKHEASAIIFAVRFFHQYLYGRSLKLETDHKPLCKILEPFPLSCGKNAEMGVNPECLPV